MNSLQTENTKTSSDLAWAAIPFGLRIMQAWDRRRRISSTRPPVLNRAASAKGSQLIQTQA